MIGSSTAEPATETLRRDNMANPPTGRRYVQWAPSRSDTVAHRRGRRRER